MARARAISARRGRAAVAAGSRSAVAARASSRKRPPAKASGARGPKAAEAAPWLEPLLAEGEEDEIRVLAAATLKRVGRETARSREILAGVLADKGHPQHGFAVSLDQQDDAGR